MHMKVSTAFRDVVQFRYWQLSSLLQLQVYFPLPIPTKAEQLITQQSHASAFLGSAVSSNALYPTQNI